MTDTLEINDHGLEVLKKCAIPVAEGYINQYKLRVDADLALDGISTEAKQDIVIGHIDEIESKLDTLHDDLSAGITIDMSATNDKLDTINSSIGDISDKIPSILTVVDQIDTTPLLDTSLTNIPASASAPVTVVASLAADVKKIVSVEDIGEFIGVYSDPTGSPVLLCILPLGGGEIDVSINSGTAIGLRNMKNAAIASGMIALNFLG